MKKILILSAILMIGISPMLSAQYAPEDLTGMVNVSPFGGIAIPTGFMQGSPENGGFDRKLGFDFGAGGEYFFNPYVGAGVDFMYSMFKANDSDDKFNIFMIGAHVKLAYNTPDMPVIPYATVGGGFAIPKWKDVSGLVEGTTVDPELKNRPYIAGNVGVMYFATENLSIFIEGGGAMVFMKDTDVTYDNTTMNFPKNVTFAPIKVGINYWFEVGGYSE
jgi:opacity protein-like surface antigen